MLEIHNTTDWPYEKVAPYGPAITAAMHKLVARYPKDVTLKGLAADVISGKQQLWLILEGEAFSSFVLTEIRTNPATENKAVMVTSMAGEDGPVSAPLIAKIEDWARSIGAHEVSVLGRVGWRKLLGREGYATDAVLYRKDLT